jgi:hypothetical protein
MRKYILSTVVVSAAWASCLTTPVANAADVAGLTWGQFVTGNTSEAQSPNVELSSVHGKLLAKIRVGDLSANADGDKTNASATFTGEFLLTQPKHSDLGAFRATIGGLIVKTSGSTARIDLTFGDIKKTIEWQTADVKSERFEQVITAVVPGGRVPVPFPVSALLLTTKPADSGAVLLTVDSIEIELAPALVGENAKPTAPWMLPAAMLAR